MPWEISWSRIKLFQNSSVWMYTSHKGNTFFFGQTWLQYLVCHVIWSCFPHARPSPHTGRSSVRFVYCCFQGAKPGLVAVLYMSSVPTCHCQDRGTQQMYTLLSRLSPGSPRAGAQLHAKEHPAPAHPKLFRADRNWCFSKHPSVAVIVAGSGMLNVGFSFQSACSQVGNRAWERGTHKNMIQTQTKKWNEQRSMRQRRAEFSCGIIWPRELESNVPSLPRCTHAPSLTRRAEQKGGHRAYEQQATCQLDTLKSFKGHSLWKEQSLIMWKNTFPYGKDLFEISGGIEPISVLLRASVKWAPSLRHPTAGDVWETPQVSRGSCFGLGGFHGLPCTQRLVEVWH